MLRDFLRPAVHVFRRARNRRDQGLQETAIRDLAPHMFTKISPVLKYDCYRRAERLAGLLGTSPRFIVQQLYLSSDTLVEVELSMPKTSTSVSVKLRPGTADVIALDETFNGSYHRSLWSIGDGQLIVDLGANIGLTMLDFAHHHPTARILGVELDSDNAELARLNTAGVADRCEVVQAGISSRDGVVLYEAPEDNPISYAIAPSEDRGGNLRSAPGLTIDSALVRFGVADQPVALLKMDIEGAEADVLASGGNWPSSVRRMLVEIHDPYTPKRCIGDLRSLGFDAWIDKRHWAAVAATRTSNVGVSGTDAGSGDRLGL